MLNHTRSVNPTHNYHNPWWFSSSTLLLLEDNFSKQFLLLPELALLSEAPDELDDDTDASDTLCLPLARGVQVSADSSELWSCFGTTLSLKWGFNGTAPTAGGLLDSPSDSPKYNWGVSQEVFQCW